MWCEWGELSVHEDHFCWFTACRQEELAADKLLNKQTIRYGQPGGHEDHPYQVKHTASKVTKWRPGELLTLPASCRVTAPVSNSNVSLAKVKASRLNLLADISINANMFKWNRCLDNSRIREGFSYDNTGILQSVDLEVLLLSSDCGSWTFRGITFHSLKWQPVKVFKCCPGCCL